MKPGQREATGMVPTETRALVAGATGYLGGFVCMEFKKRGYFVRALARSASRLDLMENHLDEVVQGEITKPDTIHDICSGIDVVFSSVGITKQTGSLTFRDVDFQGNKNLLEVARRAGVRKFVYVSVFDGPNLNHLDIVRAHEDFVEELKGSGMDYTVIRPTGFFSDMGEYFRMAQKGRAYLVGRGENRINPIHGSDLAVVCVDATEGSDEEVDVGGPQALSHREIAETAFEALGKPPKISSIPVWIMTAAVSATRLFNGHKAELLAFFVAVATTDMVAPTRGIRTLKSHFEELASSG